MFEKGKAEFFFFLDHRQLKEMLKVLKVNYDFEVIKDSSVTSGATAGVRYRVRHVATDNAIASCYDKANATLVVRALNELEADYMSFMRDAFADA